MTLAYQAHSATSRAAATSMIERAPSIRERVYSFIEGRGIHGATNEEIESNLGISGSTERPRVVELVASGRVVATDGTRKTFSGRDAIVWCTSEHTGVPAKRKVNKYETAAREAHALLQKGRDYDAYRVLNAVVGAV